MDMPNTKNDLRTRLLRLVKTSGAKAGAPVPGSSGQDRTITKKPLWQRYWKLAAALLTCTAGAVWLLASQGGGNVYRAPLDQLD